jgi:hypothetical protein
MYALHEQHIDDDLIKANWEFIIPHCCSMLAASLLLLNDKQPYMVIYIKAVSSLARIPSSARSSGFSQQQFAASLTHHFLL